MKRPFVPLVLVFAAGIATAAGGLASTLGGVVAAALACVAPFRERIIRHHLALYAAFFLIAMALVWQGARLPPNHIARFLTGEARSVTVEGVIVSDPTLRVVAAGTAKADCILRVKAVREGEAWRRATGIVEVDLYGRDASRISYGDHIAASGILARPRSLRNPGGFDYARYLANRGIYAVLKIPERSFCEVMAHAPRSSVTSLAYRFRRRVSAVIDASLPSPCNLFLKAILVGDRSGLTTDLQDDFVKTGTVHIIAISGLNVGLVAAIILTLFALLGISRRWSLLLTLGALVFYAIAAGGGAPLVRATVIYALWAGAYLLRRDADHLNSLALAALAILFIQPRALFDTSFQLSFLSVGSIVLLVSPLNRLLGIDRIRADTVSRRIALSMLTGMSVSVAAWAGTWPVIAACFNIASPIAIIANIVVVPLLFVITAYAFLFIPAALCGIGTPLLAGGMALLEQFLFGVNHLFASVPLGFFRIPAPAPVVVMLYYALIGTFFLPRGGRLGACGITRRRLSIALLIALNVAVWTELCPSREGTVRATFLDVGQGDAAVVEFPDGETMVIDGGPGGPGERFDAGRFVLAPYLWNRGITRIGTVVVTHPHSDHLGGIIYLLDNFEVDCVVDSGAAAPRDPLYRAYRERIARRHIRHLSVGKGEVLRVAAGARAFVLNPPKGAVRAETMNDDSLVVKLMTGAGSILFGADIREEGIRRLLSDGVFLRSDVLKMPHHGGMLGEEATIGRFIREVAPRIIVISAGERNLYRLPSPKTMALLAQSGARSYLTKECGAITVIFSRKDGVRALTESKVGEN